jgi:hypothetical protein
VKRFEDQLRETLGAVASNAEQPHDASLVLRKARQRQRRARGIAAASLLAVVAIIGVAVVNVRHRSPGTQRVAVADAVTSTTSTSTKSTTQPGTITITGAPEQVVTAGPQGVALVSTTSGEQLAVLDHRTANQVALGPDGSVWYVVVPDGEVPPEIWETAIGREAKSVVADANSLAVSADGHYLAYATEPTVGDGHFNTLVVRDLRDGTERRWRGLHTATSGANATIASIAWAPGSEELAFSFAYGFELNSYQTRVLNLATDASLDDARAINGNYTSPAWESDGSLLVVQPFAKTSGSDPVVKFTSNESAPVPDPRFQGMDVSSIDLDASGRLLLAVVGDAVYVENHGGNPHEVTSNIYSSGW